jgi:uncharacterized protein (TIGR02284 family)
MTAKTNMNRFDKSTEIMHDLLLIQNDRKAAYEKIVEWPDHNESIRHHIKKIIMQSRNAILELRRHIDMTGSDPADRAHIRGEIYHSWSGSGEFVPSDSISDVIAALENKEKEVAMAYQKALQPEDTLDEELRTLLNDQLSLIQRSFNYIQEYKEKPLERASTSEEEKPFVIYRERIFIGPSVHSRLIDLFD